MMNRLPLFLIALSFAVPAKAIDLGFANEDGGHPGAFLDFAANARSIGMGRAHVAVADDAGATYWNPSGLTQIERKDVVTSYSVLEEDTGLGFASFAMPTVDWGTFGLGVVNLRSSNFEGRDQSGQITGNFNQNETAILLSHGIRVKQKVSFGSTVKVIRQKIQNFDDVGYGLDFGFLYHFRPHLQFGGAIHNVLAPKLTLKKEAEKYPLDLRLGARYLIGEKWIIAADVNQTADRSFKPLLGAEYALARVLRVRAGVNETEVTAGLGFQLGDWGLDYAFGYNDAASGIEALGDSHRFGFHFNFGNKVADEKRSVRWQKRGRLYLTALRSRMEQPDTKMTDDLKRLIAGTRRVIRHQGYLNPVDLYTAQGYVYYFNGEYERSVRALYEATVLDPVSSRLKMHLEKARAHMTEEQKVQIIALEIRRVRELFENGDLHGTVRSCKIVLSHDPSNVEAQAYLDDAQKRIQEPIDRELRIARIKMERKQYLEVIKHLLKVKEMAPENTQAAASMREAMNALKKQASKRFKRNASAEVFLLGQDPGLSQQYYGKGLLYYSKGQLKDAVSAWKRAASLDQNNELARNAYNRAMIELEEQKEQSKIEK